LGKIQKGSSFLKSGETIYFPAEKSNENVGENCQLNVNAIKIICVPRGWFKKPTRLYKDVDISLSRKSYERTGDV